MTDAKVPDLPTWQEMSHLDRGIALLHVHSRDNDDWTTKTGEAYDASYIDHPDLAALATAEANAHAKEVAAPVIAALTAVENLGFDPWEEYLALIDRASTEYDKRGW